MIRRTKRINEECVKRAEKIVHIVKLSRNIKYYILNILWLVLFRLTKLHKDIETHNYM